MATGDFDGDSDDIAALPWNRTDLPAVAAALSHLDAADGEPEVVWHDDGANSFAYHGSLLETLRLTRPVALWRVDHDDAGHLFSLAAGGYTVAWTGRYRLRPAGIGYTTTDPPDVYDAAEALSCTTATATCRTCTAAWTAEDGSTIFTPATGAGATWRIGDTDHTDDTMACPVTGCGGRIGFTIT